jgi:2-polyprenyl-6-methoxyphenol hydroxylase-like FAD-dependent oxidoreductase
VLVSGAGIAGPTLGYWLARHGMAPTLVEKAPRLRTGGYIVDFWGAGFEVADRMGLLPAIREKGYAVREVRVVDGGGRRRAGFEADVFSRLSGGRYVSLPRGDLAAAIFGAASERVEAIFGDSVAGLEPDGRTIQVRFESGAERQFDLVVGADGLHSRVREIAFGPEHRFERFLGYRVAAFEAVGYRPRDELTYVMYTEVGQQVARFAMRGDRTMFLFIFADAAPEGAESGGLPAQKAALRVRFGRSGWECRRILEALDGADELYFDRVSQIRMGAEPGAWTRGRVTLLGDAACCVSFLAGQGSALAMAGAYLLAAELRGAAEDVSGALSRYERSFAPFVRAKQHAALRLAGAFAPRSRVSMFVRNQAMNLLAIPWFADLVIGRDLKDRLALPEP